MMAQSVCCSKCPYLNQDMTVEVDFVKETVQPDPGTFWSTPIAHIIAQDPIVCC